MARIFISYARKDGADLANWLYYEFLDRDIEAFLDVNDLNPFEAFPDELRNAIESATHVVVVCSADLNRMNSYCHKEIKHALDHGKRIIPLSVPDGYIPESIYDLTWIDFKDWDAGLTQLLARMKKYEALDVEEYLKGILAEDDFAKWEKLFTDLEGSSRRTIARSPEAFKHFETEHRIHQVINHDENDDEARITITNTFEELRNGIFGNYRRVAITGDPGAGKSTTLRRLTYELAKTAAKFWKNGIFPDRERQARAPLPLFVVLGSYNQDEGTFNDYINKEFGNNHLRIEDYLPDRLVLLLDGLNEISDESAKSVQEWIEEHSETALVVSCRKRDYDKLKLPVNRIDVKPLDVTRIYKFIENFVTTEDAEVFFWGLTGAETRKVWEWYNENTTDDTGFHDFWFRKDKIGNRADAYQKYLHKLRTELKEENILPGMLGVVTNPYLLNIVAKSYYNKGTFPKNKYDIFNQFVKGRFEEVLTPDVNGIDADVLERALTRLAYRIQTTSNRTIIDYADARKFVREVSRQDDVDLILRLAASCNILELSSSVQFTHQLLQEYFAAKEMYEDMDRGVPASKYFPDDRWWETTWWDETAILLAGMTGDSSAVVRWLTPVQPSLAYRCATESGSPCSPEALQALYEPAEGARRCPLARAAWGRLIAENGKDKRSGIGVGDNGIPDIEWCEVPAGSFVMGGDEGVARTFWDAETFDLDYVYKIAKYPITVAQYEGFVNEQGYQTESYWTKAGWQWKLDNNITQPGYWNDPTYHLSNHPVVGLSWYECYAYTQWLSEKLGYVVRLPTEAEYEKAARYPDGRFYPWGNDYQIGAANVDETNENAKVGSYQVDRTTAVGLYEHMVSALGIHDLSGNIWEWSLSPLNARYQHHLPEEVDMDGEERRETRGGSWKNDASRARIAYRGSNPPESQDQTDGFRLVTTNESIQDWQARVNEVSTKRFGQPSGNFIRRLRGTITQFGGTEGVIRQDDGGMISFEMMEVSPPADYNSEFPKITLRSIVEFEIAGEGENAKAIKIKNRIKGIVEDWDRERAYGYIRFGQNEDDRLYMHQSEIVFIKDWRAMQDGDEVEFEIGEGTLYGKKDWEANSVRIIVS